MNYNQFYNGHNAGKKDQKGFPSIINGDVHSIPGALTCSRKQEKISASLIDAKPELTAILPNGDTFWANSTNGKIWKESNGVVTLVHTDTNGAHFGLEYSKGYLYYASATKLGRIAEANASSEATWSSHNNAWATFTNTNTKIFKMAEVRGKLLIPNGRQLAWVSYLGAFNANALDFYPDYKITCVHPNGNTAVIGADNGNQTAIFTWDTLNSTWLWEDYVPEVGANMFIRLDNEIAIQIGAIGNIYKWTGRTAVLHSRLRNNGDITTFLNPYGSANLNGLPLIATTQGIYSIGKADAQFPEAQVIEYTPSTAGATCYGLQTRGNLIIGGWGSGSTYGIDKTGTGYATAVITTPETKGKELSVYYDTLPGSSTITAQISKDGGAFTAHLLGNSSDDLMRMKSKEEFSPKRRMQAKVVLTPNGTDVPIIDNIAIE